MFTSKPEINVEPKHKTAADIARDREDKKRLISKVVENMRMRQWAVEQAVKITSAQATVEYHPPVVVPREFKEISETTPSVFSEYDENPKISAFIVVITKELTEYFYDFITKDAEKLAKD